MTGSITALYAAILALIVVALGINVTVHRVKLSVPLGDGGDAQMRRMVRIHANAVEYLPLALVLMLIYEVVGGTHTLLHIAGIVLVAARLLQSWGMWSRDEPGFGRGVGQTLTWFTIAALAVLVLVRIV